MKIHLKTILVSVVGILLSICPVNAQVAGDAPYTLEQSVIAAGGGTSAEGGNFTLTATIGQPVAGTRSSNSSYAVAGGFWAADNFAPTAAAVSIGGRVLTLDGAGLQNSQVTLADGRGNPRTVLSGARGAFRFTDVAAGETYVISVVSRRYIFAPQVIFIGEDLNDLVLTAIGRTGTGLLKP